MNSISQTRQDVADTLRDAGLNAFASLPDRMTPPLVGVTHGSPLVESGDSPAIGSTKVNLVVRIILAPGDSDLRMEELEDAVSTVVLALQPDQWTYYTDPVGSITVGTAEYPAVDINITNDITL